ncbi:FERM and PDZ domain-containing protein 1 [Alligator sinensis]|uniref:FERM and PDZ domain-containing protein 1 n=1 Tax=Alligator sinensis TaxID=38654 RepID=A0A3Q0GC11_ALLSI|nr:FERM and PDZ domain-containing protein 1 [Alligator sinensis]
MEDLETNSFQSRKSCRIEQMVARWIRRSRDSASRGRTSVVDIPSDGINQLLTRVKLTVTIHKDLLLGHYGFEISPNLPLTITSVAAGSTADGKILPSDQILKINSEAVEGISIEKAADIIRESGDELLLTVLRCTSGGPKSSFLTEEKRARLKTNPVKVRFAEEVLVNGHSQGNSLLCMPNVLKVYLENGQTKAFKFESTTTVKDIILTLKEKLSIQSIEHFALVLEEQYNIAKLYLLHEDELIEQVVQRKESHDYRCLLRVCFIPKDPLDLLQEDPVAFEYLYLQSCSDVLQERFAVEMKCSVALRLAALHIQERIYACAQPQKVSLKYIAKDWGIENFISPTLLRNMRGKDIKKAISFHMKRNQILLDPRQKHVLSAVQVRLCYLQILGDLKMYGGKIFNATLMLQDRESYVALLVGAKYGISQIINNKLNIITTLGEFANISRLELTEESEKVSMVKIYLQDVKLLTLLLESNSAKDLACLIAGYYRLFVDSGVSIFRWGEDKQEQHRISAEEGYVSRACSDSEDSWELDSSAEHCSDAHLLKFSITGPPGEEEEQVKFCELEEDSTKPRPEGKGLCNGNDNLTDSASEASDSANTESRGCKTSGSSDSMDALEEDDLDACSVSRPEFFHFYTPTVQELSNQDKNFTLTGEEGTSQAEAEDFLCFLQIPQAPNPASEQQGENKTRASALECKLLESNVMEYYSLCTKISPTGNGERNFLNHNPGGGSAKDLLGEAGGKEGPCRAEHTAEVNDLILDPPPGFGDTSSEDEFYDAADRFTPTEAVAGFSTLPHESPDDSCFLKKSKCCHLGEGWMSRQTTREKYRKEKELTYSKSLRKRRSFLQTDYTSQVSFPLAPSVSLNSTECSGRCERTPNLSLLSRSPTVSSLNDAKEDAAVLETKTFAQLKPQREAKRKNHSSDLMEMEPETMEIKSITDSVVSSISAIRLRSDQGGKESLESTSLSNSATNSLSPLHSAQVPDERSSASPSLQLEDKRDLPEDQARGTLANPDGYYNPFLKTEDDDVACAAQHDQPISECTLEPLKAQSEGNTDSEHHGQGLISSCTERAVPAVVCYRDKLSSGAAPSERDLPSTIELEEMGKELVSSTFDQRTTDFAHRAVSQPAEVLLQEEASKMVNEESSWKAEDKNHVGFSNATELLSDFEGAFGIITRFSLLSLGTRTDQTTPCQEASGQSGGMMESHPTALGQDLRSSDQGSANSVCAGIGIPSKETPLSSMWTASQKKCPPSETAGDLRVEGREPSNGVPHVDCSYEQPQASLTLPTEEATKQRKDCTSDLNPAVTPPSTIDNCEVSEDAEENIGSNPSFLCFNHERDRQASPSGSTDTPLGFASIKDTHLPKTEVDKCSCQLSYVSCFRGLQSEVDNESVGSAHTISSGPLTRPPSAGSLSSVGQNPFRTTEDGHDADIKPKGSEDGEGPHSHTEALAQLRESAQKSPAKFSHLLDNTTKLQELVGKFSGNRMRHPQEKCAEQFSENKNALSLASQKLMSHCQEVLKMDPPSEELQGALQETFQDLLQLTATCFQFTNCGLCTKRHRELTVNLKDVVCSYQEFVHAAQQLGEKNCHDLSAKLLAHQCTALTAAVFCLMQHFRALLLV